jgi:hypothetical protein
MESWKEMVHRLKSIATEPIDVADYLFFIEHEITFEMLSCQRLAQPKFSRNKLFSSTSLA